MEIIDKFHYHEIADRCHLICSMIDDFVLEHPACSEQMKTWAEDAQRQLINIIQTSGFAEDKLNK